MVAHQHQIINDTTSRLVDKTNEFTAKEGELMANSAEIHHLNE